MVRKIGCRIPACQAGEYYVRHARMRPHGNTGLRAIFMKCLAESLLLGNGACFDVEVIRKKDPAFAEAVEKGFIWIVLEQIIIDAFPALVGLFDASRNAIGHIQTPESDVSGMNKFTMEWADCLKRKGVPQFVEITKAVVRSRPSWAVHVHFMVAFLSTQAGGTNSEMWSKFKDIHNHYVPSTQRQIPGRVLESLSLVKCPPVVYAVLLAVCLCPESHVINKQCEWFSTADLAKLKPNKEKEPAKVVALQNSADFLIALKKCLDVGGS